MVRMKMTQKVAFAVRTSILHQIYYKASTVQEEKNKKSWEEMKRRRNGKEEQDMKVYQISFSSGRIFSVRFLDFAIFFFFSFFG